MSGMKLWQRIFISTLLLVILAMDVTAVLLLSNNHRLMIEREEQRVLSEHAYIASTLADSVLYTRIKQNRVLLGEEETLKAVESLAGNNLQGISISLYQNGERVVSSSPCSVDAERPLFASLSGENRVLQIIQDGETVRMLTASELKLEGRSYVLVTSADVTEIYTLRSEQITYVKNMSILCALAVAGVLLVMVWLLLWPLHRINTNMRRIARGNYSKRLAVRGGGEVAELARTMNTMADAVEKNVSDLEQVAEERKTFIANLAHEMKTPLTSIMGFADILRVKRVVSDGERQEYANVIVEETKRLRALSGKLMELISVGGMQPDCREVSLRELLQEVHFALQPVLAGREISLLWSAPDVSIQADSELFKSLLYNLIDNGSKASRPGQTVIIESGYREGRLFLSVIDHGMGIPPKELKRITEPFYMVDKARTRKAGGAGLGLALCVEIARLHHAVLSIDSALGQGTCVTILFDEEG